MTIGTAEGLRTRTRVRLGDRVFSISTVVAGTIILAILSAVAIFLILPSLPAVFAQPASLPIDSVNFWAYVWLFVFGTLCVAFLALFMATPFVIGIALFISYWAPRR